MVSAKELIKTYLQPFKAAVHRDRDRLYYDSSIRGYFVVIYNNKIICTKNFIKVEIYTFSIYTLSDLGVLSNLIGSLSLANEHYSPPTEWIMRKPNKNKMAGVNSYFASVSESIFNGFLLKMLLRSLPVYILKQLFFSISVTSGRIFCHYSPRFQRIIVKYCE